MLPGYNSSHTDVYMDITEGFADLAKKEKFTMDELDKIVEAEEPAPTMPAKAMVNTAQSSGATSTTSAMVVAEEEVMPEPPATPTVLAEEDEDIATTTTKGAAAVEGFQGSQYVMAREMKFVLIVLALTGLCFILNLEETDRYIASFIKNKCYVLIIRLAIFAVAAYVLLLLGNYLA